MPAAPVRRGSAMTIEQIDQAKAEAFAGKMIAVINGACLSLMTSIGHRTGLFDKMAVLPPATTAQIADATGLNERYVREWLGGGGGGGRGGGASPSRPRHPATA